jgi:hypothetical protein
MAAMNCVAGCSGERAVFGNHRFRLDEITPAMRPASEVGQPVAFGDSAIDLVPVAHQGRAAFDAGIQGFGMGSTSSTGVTEQPDRWSAAGGLCPEITLRLRLLAGFLQHLDRRLVGVDEIGIEQVVAQQVDDRLHRFADLDEARRQRIAREVAAEATQECCLPVQRQGVHILRGHHPGQCRFRQQSLGNDPCRCRRHLDALVAAGAGVFHPLVLDDPDLLGNDVELFADFDTDLDQATPSWAQMRSDSGNSWRTMSRGRLGSSGLRPRFLRVWAGIVDVHRRSSATGVPAGASFGFVEEHVLLLATAYFRFGVEQLAQMGLEPFFEQADFDLQRAHLAAQSIALAAQCVPVSNKRCVFFGGQGDRRHVRD